MNEWIYEAAWWFQDALLFVLSPSFRRHRRGMKKWRQEWQS